MKKSDLLETFPTTRSGFVCTCSLLVILACYALYGLAQSLFNHSPWYDEAMQFWISFGCSPDEIAFDNGMMEVVKLNQLFNHDPGGFSLLLHFWLKASQDIVWIRILPLLLFFSSLLLIYPTARALLGDKLLSFLCCLTPLTSDSLLYFSSEIRAYSMECLCSSLAVLAVCTLPERKEPAKIFGLSIALCLLMTSRYSAMIEVALSMFVVALHWFYHIKARALPRVLLILIPYIAFAGLIYFFSLSPQNPSVQTPSYIDSSIQWDFLNMLIFVTPPCFLVLFYRTRDERFFLITLYITLLNFFFLALALLEIHPADVRSKYCIGMHFANLVFFVLLFARVLNLSRQPRSRLGAIGLVTLGILLQHKSLRMRNGQDFFETAKLCRLSGKKIYVDKSLSPVVNYLLSFGEDRCREAKSLNEISFQKQTSHVLGLDGLFLEAENDKLDFSTFDVIITSRRLAQDHAIGWKQQSDHIYLKN